MQAHIYRSSRRLLIEGLEGAALLTGALATWPVSKRWLRDWGSEEGERRRSWAGDRLVSSNPEPSTRGIDIAAPAPVVWQWVVQFGLGRAGFYSYELLERLIGIPVTNLESIAPEFQSIAVGDEIKLHPKAPGIPVAMVEPGASVCFGQAPGSEAPEEHPGRSWSFYIQPIDDDSSRLIIRGCFEPATSLVKRIAAAVEEPIDFVMEQRMLRTIKRLAEEMQRMPSRFRATTRPR
ncbi:MAG: hypothetical protein DRJ42_05800 [Deltaproteobacteria bacterium]|nr:MAG: hypothetical protein DRJ42_05800 [Deltaproteobacteria bacterium]